MKRHPIARHAFTLVEVLAVMSIIALLAAMVFAGAGMMHDKAGRHRAEAEIAAFSMQLEAFKADNGSYPRSLPNSTANEADQLDARAGQLPTAAASLVLYTSLSGDGYLNRSISLGAKQYMEFRPNQLLPRGQQATTVTALVDPWGNPYGYSTAYLSIVEKTGTPPPGGSSGGYNPTYDLWSTGGKSSNAEAKWLKNW